MSKLVTLLKRSTMPALYGAASAVVVGFAAKSVATKSLTFPKSADDFKRAIPDAAFGLLAGAVAPHIYKGRPNTAGMIAGASLPIGGLAYGLVAQGVSKAIA